LHAKLIDRLIPPALRQPSPDLLRCRILAGLLFYVLLTTTTMAMARLFTQGLESSTYVTLAGVPVFLSLFAVFWVSQSRRLTADLLVIMVILIVAVTAWNDGGLYSRAILWWTVLPLVANFIGGYIRAVWTTLTGWIILLMMYIAHLQSALPDLIPGDPVTGRLAAAMASMLFVAVISYLYEDSHRRVENERQALDQSKHNWVAMVSHELRTPLTAIRGALGLVIGTRTEELSPDSRQMLNIAHNNCERLVALINDVLDVEKLENGSLKLSPQPTDLLSLLREVQSSNQVLAHDKQVNIVIETDESSLIIDLDPNRIFQVLQNLVSNAVKFAPAQSEVCIRLLRDQTTARVSVSDQGPGLLPEDRDKVFERFYQGSQSAVKQQGGTGLGLHISKAMVEMHGGQIGLEDKPEGGATFYFTLPLS
jgi:signal transduction histidine kinase